MMAGKYFMIEPRLSEDPLFKTAVDSVEEAHRLFKPVDPRAFLTDAARARKEAEVVQRERREEREHAQHLVNLNSALTRENKALQQGLSDANRRADELEHSVQCAVCQVQKVSVAFMPCGHACCCKACWKTWSEQHSSFAPCPLCRKQTVASMEMRW